jgi:hypothetical protein
VHSSTSRQAAGLPADACPRCRGRLLSRSIPSFPSEVGRRAPPIALRLRSPLCPACTIQASTRIGARSSCDASLLAAAATGATRPGRLRWLAAHCDCTRSFAVISPGSPQPQPPLGSPTLAVMSVGVCFAESCAESSAALHCAEVLRAPCEAMLRVRTHWRSPSRRHRCVQRVLNGHGCSHMPSPMAVSCHGATDGPHWSWLATPTRATCNECHLPVPQHPLELSSQVIVLALPLV